jgi:hypothetical protein
MQITFSALCFSVAWGEICKMGQNKASKNISYWSSLHSKLEFGGDSSKKKRGGENLHSDVKSYR